MIELTLDTSNLFVTSDLHLNHKNIIKYCDRPWEFSDEGREAMNHALIENLMSLPEGCALLNLGGAKSVWHTGLEKILLNGKYYLAHEPFFLREEDRLVLHGHIHNNPLHREDEWSSNVNKKLLDNYINCCADVHDFKPVLFSDLVAGL